MRMTDNTVKILYDEKCILTLCPRIHYLLQARDRCTDQKIRDKTLLFHKPNDLTRPLPVFNEIEIT